MVLALKNEHQLTPIQVLITKHKWHMNSLATVQDQAPSHTVKAIMRGYCDSKRKTQLATLSFSSQVYLTEAHSEVLVDLE